MPCRGCYSSKTLNYILALRRILERAKEKNLSTVLLFIDFNKKAFDSVHRGLFMKILKAYGIPEEIVKLIESWYIGTRAKVRTADGQTDRSTSRGHSCSLPARHCD